MSRKFGFTSRVFAVVALGLVTAFGFTGATSTATASNSSWCC